MKLSSTERFLFTCFAAIFCLGLTTSILIDKLEIIKAINDFHLPVLDYLFFGLTKLAEGWGTVPVLVYFAFKNRKKLLYFGIVYFVSSAIAQSVKHWVFNDHYRPEFYFQKDPSYYFIPWLEIPMWYSFPSGHTTTAFAFLTGFILLQQSKKLVIPLLTLACIIGFSRMYLSMHFLQDVVAGSILGFSTAALTYFFLKKKVQFNS